eukprot:7139952-Pyramimonas_sp.AAC.1
MFYPHPGEKPFAGLEDAVGCACARVCVCARVSNSSFPTISVTRSRGNSAEPLPHLTAIMSAEGLSLGGG